MESLLQGITATTVEQQLRRLCSSPRFSHSRRYPLFLEYVVRKTLDGQSDDLKERIVGVEAFGRPSDYDLNADPVVRVTAGEVRKRLAQYYYDSGHDDELRIELHPGSYVPEFKLAGKNVQRVSADLAAAEGLPELAPEPPDSSPKVFLQSESVIGAANPIPDARARKWKVLSAVLSLTLIAVIAVAIQPFIRPASSTDLFWRPVVEANGPVIISVGSVVAMVNGNAVAPPAYTVSGHPLSSDPIAVSDATALSRIQQVLSTRSKTSTLESSTSTSFSDLQKGPIVLISGFNNQWTMRLTEPLRFHFVRTSNDEYRIEDHDNPANHQWEINTGGAFVNMDVDFGIVARFHDSTTDQMVVVAAGIGENGTIAASQVLTDDKYLSQLRSDKLMMHPSKNFEAVVETRVIDGKPGPPRILAAHTW